MSRFAPEEIDKMSVDEFRANRLCIPMAITVGGQEEIVYVCSDAKTLEVYKKGLKAGRVVYFIDEMAALEKATDEEKVRVHNSKKSGKSPTSRLSPMQVAAAFRGKVEGRDRTLFMVKDDKGALQPEDASYRRIAGEMYVTGGVCMLHGDKFAVKSVHGVTVCGECHPMHERVVQK